jgi:uncharacterized RDD family membrane protein YckC
MHLSELARHLHSNNAGRRPIGHAFNNPMIEMNRRGAADAPAFALAGLGRRLACFVYEGVLLFGVLMVAGFAYSTLTQQRHALEGTTGLQIVVFLTLGVYFAGFWSWKGQTLAMQTWQIRLLTTSGARVSPVRAFCRYLLSWLWFVPALLAVSLSGLKGSGPTFGAIFAGVAAYATLTRLRPDRQYWHDAVCGTCLVIAPALKRR